MLEMSENARQRLERYLQQVRMCLKGSKTVDPDEVESNIMEHIECELGGAAAVSYDDLDAVLARLGSPRQWLPADEMSPWRKMIVRMRTGPDDWRLAYISFGLLVVGAVFLPSCIVLWPAAFVFARAAIAESGNSQDLKAQRWLIYPPLLAIYIPLTLGLLFWPSTLVVVVGEMLEQSYEHTNSPLAEDTHCWVIAWCICLTAQGLWWLIFGGMLLKLRRVAAVVFRPFAGWFGLKWVVIMMIAGLVFAGGFFAAGMLYFRYVIVM